MSRRAVTSAQIARTVKAIEAMGKSVAEIIDMPDGSKRYVLTTGAEMPPPSDSDAEWARRLDRWRGSA